MKKTFLIFSLGLFTMAGLQAQDLSLALTPTSPEVDQAFHFNEKIRMDGNDLPEAVKTTISEDEETQTLLISEAYQVTEAEEGTVHYEVVFGMEAEATTKKYDAEGNKIKEEK